MRTSSHHSWAVAMLLAVPLAVAAAPSVAVPPAPTGYRSTLADYRPYVATSLADWGAANATVGQAATGMAHDHPAPPPHHGDGASRVDAGHGFGHDHAGAHR